MKIVIVGVGAMGSLFAAYLGRRQQEEVWALDKDKDRAAKINHEGITVEDTSGTWKAKLNVSAEAGLIGQADLILVCVKSYNTREAILKAKPLVGENTQVLTLQNGIGNLEIIGEIIGPEKVLGGITNQGSTLIAHGHIRHAGKGETVIGRLDGKINAGIRSLRELFIKAGLETRISRDIKALFWSKLVVNAGINALTAIARLNNGRLLELEWTRKILREAVGEAVRLAKRKRIRLDCDDPLAKAETVCEATAANVSSMLQDVLKKKRTEIDFINGVIVRQAQELNIPVPVNTLLTELVKTIEASYNFSL